MVRIRVIILMMIMFFSCNKIEHEKNFNDNTNEECRFGNPHPIFKDVFCIEHSFVKEDGVEYMIFKDSLEAPFESLKIIHEGCDVLIQSFVFEDGKNIRDNFLFLGTLGPEYVGYAQISDKLYKYIEPKAWHELQNDFFFKVEYKGKYTTAVISQVEFD